LREAKLCITVRRLRIDAAAQGQTRQECQERGTKDQGASDRGTIRILDSKISFAYLGVLYRGASITHVTSPRTIALLGSTGSIGRSTLEVVANFPDRFRVVYLCANRNIDLLREQINTFRPKGVVLFDPDRAAVLRATIGTSVEVLCGWDGLLDVVSRDDVDIVLSSLVGFAGLKPTLRAVEAGKDIALANKETLVVGGELIMAQVRAKRVRLLPVDSEHSAIFQCLQGEDPRTIERLVLTASGGPFLHVAREKFPSVTVTEALAHPTWRMGHKITIDSATLMNKGLEVIEAYWLFGVPPEKIEVVIHPQSVIHSMVEFVDGSIKAQLGLPDMKLPILYALAYPARLVSSSRRIDFRTLREMSFLPPDMQKFECLGLAYRALQMGGTAPTVLNAANEVAVQMFLDGELPFSAIPSVIRDALDAHTPLHAFTLADLERIDGQTRARARGIQATTFS
jgi:1-deoxy-D-xylulose-5-phosphate reductoisomerase